MESYRQTTDDEGNVKLVKITLKERKKDDTRPPEPPNGVCRVMKKSDIDDLY